MTMKRLLYTGLLTCTLLQAELFTDYFKDGVVKSRIEYKDGTRTQTEGVMKWYDRAGNLLETLSYQNGQRHGTNKLFYDDGTKRAEVNYINDKKEGVYKEYFSTGELALEVPYKKDRKDGIQKEYFPNGALSSKVHYVNGYKEGRQIWYDKHGRIIKTESFKMDRPVDVMKKIQAKKPDATQQLLQGLDFNPNHYKAR